MTAKEIDAAVEHALSYLGKAWFEDRVPQSLVRDLAFQLAITYFNHDVYSNATNLRVAEVGDKEQVKKYIERRQHGCCGSHDFVVWFEQDDIQAGFLIGFNYGH